MSDKIACIGGATVDWIAHTEISYFPCESETYQFQKHVGGVAVNIAQILNADLFCALGQDENASYIRHALNIPIFAVDKKIPTAQIIQIYGKDGNLVRSYCDTEITDTLHLSDLSLWLKNLPFYSTWVLDTDLPQLVVEGLVREAPDQTNLFITLVSQEKANRLPQDLSKVTALFMNREELRTFHPSDDIQIACQGFFDRGCDYVFVTDGGQGAWEVSCEGYRFEKALQVGIPMVSTNGAGDAFTAGVIQAFSKQDRLLSGLRAAHHYLRKINPC